MGAEVVEVGCDAIKVEIVNLHWKVLTIGRRIKGLRGMK